MKLNSGVELTDEQLDEWAEEAERGYDLTNARRVDMRGRPSLGSAGESPKIQVRLDPELNVALRERADKEERSVSELVRDALRRYVEAA